MPWYFPDFDYESWVAPEPEESSAPIRKGADEVEFPVFPDALMGQVMIQDQPGWNSGQAPVKYNSHVTFRGRRNRVLAAYSRYLLRAPEHHTHWFTSGYGLEPGNKPVFVKDHRMTFREAFTELMGDSEPAAAARAWLSDQKLRKSGAIHTLDAIPATGTHSRPSRLHKYLHDLALMIRLDLREAIDAAHGDGYYPGVDEGIEPVTDDHVALVIWSVQRELDKERRMGPDNSTVLPAYPLETLPFPIQRAFAERRRLRYSEWNITHENWVNNSWSALAVPDDDWEPPWLTA